MNHKTIFLTLVLLMGVFFSSGVYGQEAVEGKTEHKVELTVTGMTCGGCASKQQSFLEGIEGVTAAKVDYAANKAVVSFDAEKTNEAAILASLENSPYPAKGTVVPAANSEAAHPACSGKKAKKHCDPSQCVGKKKNPEL